jgi:F-type H+-transporting ATPase subunit gamma
MAKTELKEVRRRIGATRQICKVTDALQKVSAARVARDRRAIEQARLYTRKLEDVLIDLEGGGRDWPHPLSRPSSTGTVGVMVFGSDRGLCGGFNSALLAALERFAAERRGQAVELLVMGKVINRRARRLGMNVRTFRPQPPRHEAEARVRELVDGAIDGFLDGTFREVHVLYSRLISVMRQDPVSRRLLPTPGIEGRRPRAAAYEPSAGEIRDRLLRDWVHQAAQAAFLDSAGAENAARQTAMSRAFENARKMLGDLMRTYSRLRQDNITTEVIELTTAAWHREG